MAEKAEKNKEVAREKTPRRTFTTGARPSGRAPPYLKAFCSLTDSSQSLSPLTPTPIQ